MALCFNALYNGDFDMEEMMRKLIGKKIDVGCGD